MPGSGRGVMHGFGVSRCPGASVTSSRCDSDPAPAAPRARPACCRGRRASRRGTERRRSATPPELLPVLREQAERLFGALLEKGDRETFLRLNALLALLVEAAAKRR
jgi:hypothetical protein